jgi:deoxyinosine 3'endonuclease (endonuclease V)
MKTEGRKPIYVSVGHKVGLGSAIKIVKRLVKSEEWLPEPLRIADISSKTA